MKKLLKNIGSLGNRKAVFLKDFNIKPFLVTLIDSER